MIVFLLNFDENYLIFPGSKDAILSIIQNEKILSLHILSSIADYPLPHSLYLLFLVILHNRKQLVKSHIEQFLLLSVFLDRYFSLIIYYDYPFALFSFTSIDFLQSFFDFHGIGRCRFVIMLRFHCWFNVVGFVCSDLFYFPVGICYLFGFLFVELQSFFLYLFADLINIVRVWIHNLL